MGKCPVCRMAGFCDVKDMRRHRRADHPERVVHCTCGRSFLEQAYMKQHLRDLGTRHGEARTKRRRRKNRNLSQAHPCTYSFCGSSFATPYDLNRHQEVMHPGSSFGAAAADYPTATFSSMNISSSASSSTFGSYGLPSDLYAVDSSDLDRFIAENIQADDGFLSSCGHVINELAEKLKGSSSPFSIRRVIKSGSLGKGTSVKGKSDVDLILMLNGYNDVPTLMEQMPDVLKKLENFLEEKTRATHEAKTRFSVQVSMPCGNHSHEVDILPGVDLTEMGTSTREIYRQMDEASSDDIHEYSVTLSPLQLDIIKGLPTKVKSLIRLVKYWKNEKLKDSFETEMPSFGDGQPAWPSSFAFELVVMDSWIQAGKPVSFNMTRAVHSVLTSLVNHRKLKVLLKDYMLYGAGMERHKPGRPYIMDPTNPYNDMYHGRVNGEAFAWEKTAVKAREWLEKRLFSCVENTKNRWLLSMDYLPL